MPTFPIATPKTRWGERDWFFGHGEYVEAYSNFLYVLAMARRGNSEPHRRPSSGCARTRSFCGRARPLAISPSRTVWSSQWDATSDARLARIYQFVEKRDLTMISVSNWCPERVMPRENGLTLLSIGRMQALRRKAVFNKSLDADLTKCRRPFPRQKGGGMLPIYVRIKMEFRRSK
jgi:hypothetical protein